MDSLVHIIPEFDVMQLDDANDSGDRATQLEEVVPDPMDLDDANPTSPNASLTISNHQFYNSSISFSRENGGILCFSAPCSTSETQLESTLAQHTTQPASSFSTLRMSQNGQASPQLFMSINFIKEPSVYSIQGTTHGDCLVNRVILHAPISTITPQTSNLPTTTNSMPLRILHVLIDYPEQHQTNTAPPPAR